MRQNAIAVAVAASLSHLRDVFAYQHVMNLDAAAERADTYAEIKATLIAEKAASADVGEYLSRVEYLFGNGEKGDAHIPGALRKELADIMKTDGALRSMLSKARDVGEYTATCEWAETFSKTYRAMLKARKAPDENVAGKRPKAPKGGPVNMVTPELGRLWVASNVLDALDIIERELAKRAESIDAGGIHAIRTRLIERAKQAAKS